MRKAVIGGWMLSLLLGTLWGCGPAAGDSTVGKDDLSITIDTPATVALNENPLVTVTYTNDSNEPIELLSWAVPGEGFWEDAFAVTVNGTKAAYIGRLYKRTAPDAGDLVTLAPDEAISGSVDLSRLYDLSLAGTYEVAASVSVSRLVATDASDEVIRSNSMSMFTEGRAAVEPPPLVIAYYGIAFSSCTTTRQSTLRTSLSQAETYADNAYSYLVNTTPSNNATRYKIWFGNYTSTNWSTVKTHYNNLQYRIKNNTVKFFCDCTDSAYAYVYPNRPYEIHVCNAFWNAPTAGTDSKGGTIIHEMTHFTVIAATSDHVYGVTGAKNLATTSPSKAVNNADNHEYFCERPNG